MHTEMYYCSNYLRSKVDLHTSRERIGAGILVIGQSWLLVGGELGGGSDSLLVNAGFCGLRKVPKNSRSHLSVPELCVDRLQV